MLPFHHICIDLLRLSLDPSFPQDFTVSVREGDVEKTKDLLSAERFNINRTNQYGETLLHVACRYGQLEIVKMLVDMGATVSEKDQYGCTPALVAAKGNHSEVVLALVNELGCDSNTEDGRGCTLLHEACRHGWLEIVRILISMGAAVNKVSREGTPVLLAAENNHCDIAVALIREFKCDVNEINWGRLFHIAFETWVLLW